MFSKTARVRIRKFHRWAGILIGVQLVFWIFSGAYFSWVPKKIVKDEDRAVNLEYEALPLQHVVPPQALQLPVDFKAKLMRLDNSPNGVVYRVESMDGKAVVLDAWTGKPVPYLEADRVKELVFKQINSDAPLVRSELLNEAPDEYNGPLPVYRISFEDFRQTRLYMDPWSGKILARRTMFWRVYDFLWMLHIMDFKEREDYNNIWLRGLSLSALLFVISGYLLFQFGKPPRRAF